VQHRRQPADLQPGLHRHQHQGHPVRRLLRPVGPTAPRTFGAVARVHGDRAAEPAAEPAVPNEAAWSTRTRRFVTHQAVRLTGWLRYGPPRFGDNGRVDRERRFDQATVLSDHLAGLGVRAIALTWVDNAGITRVKAVPLARFAHAAAWGVGMSPVFDVFLV